MGEKDLRSATKDRWTNWIYIEKRWVKEVNVIGCNGTAEAKRCSKMRLINLV